MGRYSHWNMYFKAQDGSDIRNILKEVNKFVSDPSSKLQGIPEECTFSLFNTGNGISEAFTDYDDFSFSSQDYAENDLKLLSEKFPGLIFHCAADIEDRPSFYINAKAGELDYNIPSVTYPGFSHIIYDQSDKPTCPYSQEDLKLSISDMDKLTEMVKAKAPAGTFSAGAPTTEIAAWALREVVKIYYGEERTVQ